MNAHHKNTNRIIWLAVAVVLLYAFVIAQDILLGILTAGLLRLVLHLARIEELLRTNLPELRSSEPLVADD